jgi:hypothetical protein
MANFTVKVETREGDVFIGTYPAVPTRETVSKGIHDGNNAESNIRLLNVVKYVRDWPNQVLVRRVEVARIDTVILGKVIFERI